MDATRITLARVLELGVRVSWHEATAIVRGAVAATVAAEGPGPAVVTTESCLLTRGGDVVLASPAAQARPEVVVRLLDDLLASCSHPGRFAGAVANGTALDMIEELSLHITAKRRRAEVAAVALRGLAAEADAASAMADTDEQNPLAGLDDALAPLPAIPVSPDPMSALPGRPALGDWEVHVPGLDHEDRIAAAETVREQSTPFNTVAAVASGTSPGLGSRFDWERAFTAALVCSALALTAGGILVPRILGPRESPVELSEPAIEASAIDDQAGLDGHTALARREPAVLPKVTDPPSVPPSVPLSVARSASRGSRIAEASVVRSAPQPTVRPETPTGNTASVAASRAPSLTPAAAPLLAAAPAPSGAPPPAVDDSFVVDRPSATASPPAEALRAASTAVPANALARSPRREDDARAIENLLGRYRTAFNNLDVGAAAAVWPTVNEKTLAKAFDGLESHNVSFESCQIEVFSVLAEAACSGSARYVPKVGSRTPKDEARRWKFSLRKAMDGWLIERVDAR